MWQSLRRSSGGGRLSGRCAAGASTHGRRFRFRPVVVLAVLFVGLIRAPQPCAQEMLSASPLTVDAHRILFPFTTEGTLDDGRAEMDRSRGRYAARVNVNPAEDHGGWTLYLRADASAFQPQGAGKACTDLKWKLDYENETAFRPVQVDDTIVLEQPSGGSAEVTIDLAVDLDWCTAPGSYRLGLVFRLAYP